MAGLFFLIAVVLAGAALLFRQAAEEIHVGTNWADEVCSTSTMFCNNPEYLLYGGVVVLIMAIGFKLGSIVDG